MLFYGVTENEHHDYGRHPVVVGDYRRASHFDFGSAHDRQDEKNSSASPRVSRRTLSWNGEKVCLARRQSKTGFLDTKQLNKFAEDVIAELVQALDVLRGLGMNFVGVDIAV